MVKTILTCTLFWSASSAQPKKAPGLPAAADQKKIPAKPQSPSGKAPASAHFKPPVLDNKLLANYAQKRCDDASLKEYLSGSFEIKNDIEVTPKDDNYRITATSMDDATGVLHELELLYPGQAKFCILEEIDSVSKSKSYYIELSIDVMKAVSDTAARLLKPEPQKIEPWK